MRWSMPTRRIRAISSRSPVWAPRCSARSRCGCSTSQAPACSTAPPDCWRRRCSRSPSWRRSTRTWHSTTCPRWLRYAPRCSAPRGCCAKAGREITCSRGSALAWRARPSTRLGSCWCPTSPPRSVGTWQRARPEIGATCSRRSSACCSQASRPRSRSSWPIPIRCSTTRASTASWCISLSSRLKRRASSGRPNMGASSTTSGP